MMFRQNLRLLTRLPSRSILQWRRTFYDSRTKLETIFAPATSVQSSKGSPLVIVRLSGSKTVPAIEAITGMKLAQLDSTPEEENLIIRKSIKPRQATLAKICDPNAKELIDVGLVLWFPKPNSYTGEDLCELHLHGSHAIIKRVLSILGGMDAVRPAEPGEFTRRAVQNSKMSLMQAEGLSELISSQTDVQRRMALRGLTGTTRYKYEKWKEELMLVLAHLEASIDFGEDELIGEQQVVADCIGKLKKLARDISLFQTVASRCRDLTKVGARVCIVGRPNAGKSSFMNLLCRQEKSIVSELSGTTRDVVEHSFELGGHNLILSDTAGLKDLDSLYASVGPATGTLTPIEQHNSIEREGIKRAVEAARTSDLVLYMVDGSQGFELEQIVRELEHFSKTVLEVDQEEKKVQDDFQQQEGKSTTSCVHVIVNKIDLNESVGNERELKTLEEKIVGKKLGRGVQSVQVTCISCRTQANLGVLIDKIKRNLNNLLRKEENINNEVEKPQLEYVNERHLALLSSVAVHLAKACELDFRTIDEMAQHVRESVDYLSRIVGTVTNEQVLDIVFRDFCIGK